MNKGKNQAARKTLLAAIVFGAAALLPALAEAQAGPFQYYALTPCRVADTRNANGVNGGPVVVGNGGARNFRIQGNCGVPVGAAAVTLNVTIAGPTGSGFLTIWPSGGAQPLVSTINFTTADAALANGAIVPLSANTDDLSIFYGGAGTVHVILDVTGYFAP
jgi:hypothetical protein